LEEQYAISERERVSSITSYRRSDAHLVDARRNEVQPLDYAIARNSTQVHTFREQNDFEKEVFMGESKPAGKVNDALYSGSRTRRWSARRNKELKARIQKLEREIQRNNQVLAKPSHQALPSPIADSCQYKVAD